MCQLLLGDAAGALAVLEEDDRAQQHLRQQQPAAARSPAPAAATAEAGSSGANGTGVASAVAGPEGRHAVMQFIRAQSPQVCVGRMQCKGSMLRLLLRLRMLLVQLLLSLQQQQCHACPGAKIATH